KVDVGQSVRLSGWVHRIRDHGGLLFVDLRDHYGLTQLVAVPESSVFDQVGSLRSECCICIDGEVRDRPPETVNTNLATGRIEIFLEGIEILGVSGDLPLPVFGEPEYPEETRLRYRFLDLRRETMRRNILKRQAIIAEVRSRMIKAGFNEFTTPVLTASSPEGARDFLVPSRLHPGRFYALPQAPQQFKQLIMMSGFDRYFQIAPCFRDEDPRADRLPGEFYQLDVEMSFVTQDDILETMEPVLCSLFKHFASGRRVTSSFPRIPYADALRKFGVDKPDLRNPIVMQDVTDHFRASNFKIFTEMIARDPKVEVWAIPARKGGSRAFCDRMNSWARDQGQPGLGYIFWRSEAPGVEAVGPIGKSLGPERSEAIRVQMDLFIGDACFFIAGRMAEFVSFAGAARTKIGTGLGLIDENAFELCWIVDFPMFERDAEKKGFAFSHNPFSLPQGGLNALQEDPLSLKAYQYDLVCNGYEIASGAVRNHKLEIMEKLFSIAGYGKDVLEERFGALYRAFQYGAPPHGGMAAGIDRIVMLLCGVDNLREVTLFPMNQQGTDLLMDAPGLASKEQLRDLHIHVAPPVLK
ncbi:MAG: aspartate--tRNA ligase, partial [Alphaproteobacteria bacterium]|nr:aspartate--tRNA ligase [Alphaproteobacteria bacterium]